MTATLLTAGDVAARLQVPRKSAYRYMARMGALRIGRHLRVTEEALAKFLEEACSDFTNGAGCGGRPSQVTSGSARAVPTGKRRSGGPPPKSDGEPIRLTQPRKRRPSPTA